MRNIPLAPATLCDRDYCRHARSVFTASEAKRRVSLLSLANTSFAPVFPLPGKRRSDALDHSKIPLAYVRYMFYITPMRSQQATRRLQEHLQAQGEMLEECSRRARQPCHWRLRSAWIGAFVRLSNALTETALVSGTLEKAAHARSGDGASADQPASAKTACSAERGGDTLPQNPQNNLKANFQSDQRFGEASCTAASSEIQRWSAERQSQCAEVRLP